jgi:hypothetical protein
MTQAYDSNNQDNKDPLRITKKQESRAVGGDSPKSNNSKFFGIDLGRLSHALGFGNDPK